VQAARVRVYPASVGNPPAEEPYGCQRPHSARQRSKFAGRGGLWSVSVHIQRVSVRNLPAEEASGPSASAFSATALEIRRQGRPTARQRSHTARQRSKSAGRGSVLAARNPVQVAETEKSPPASTGGRLYPSPLPRFPAYLPRIVLDDQRRLALNRDLLSLRYLPHPRTALLPVELQVGRRAGNL
jgi:hypothetical protein